MKVGTSPACISSGASTLEVGTFDPVVPQPEPATHLPFRLGFDRPTYRVAAGSVLRYRVMLTNAGRKPFHFGTCPDYFEAVVDTKIRREIHVLNCRPAGTIAAAAARVFAMELRVPRTMTVGVTELFFELGLGTYTPVERSSGPTVVVTAR